MDLDPRLREALADSAKRRPIWRGYLAQVMDLFTKTRSQGGDEKGR